MNNAKLKIVIFYLTFAMIIAMFPATTLFAASNWSYDSKTKTLTISYSGAMPDFDSLTQRPWDTYSKAAEKIVFKNGITTVKTSLKGSAVKTVKVKKTKVKIYKKYFTKANCGRKVTVKK